MSVRTGADPDVVLDRVLPVLTLVFTLTAVLSAAQRHPGQVGPDTVDALSWALGPALAVVLLARRRAPAATLVVSVVLLIGYYATDRAAVGLELPLAPAFFSAAQQGRTRPAWAMAAVTLLVAYGYRVLVADQGLIALAGLDFMTSMVVLVGAIGAGDAVRSRRLERQAREERLRLQAELVEEQLHASVQQERQALARDVHDVLGHSLAVIATQSSVARESLGADGVPDEQDTGAARAAVGVIRGASQEALREIRTSLRLLSGADDETRHPAAGLEQIEPLAARFDGTGLRVEVTRGAGVGPVAVPVGSTAYRVVQEALTNVVRHSDAARVQIGLEQAGDALVVTVQDDGTPTGAQGGAGSGVRGMRDRVEMLGGTLDAGPAPGRGYLVRARLPLERGGAS